MLAQIYNNTPYYALALLFWFVIWGAIGYLIGKNFKNRPVDGAIMGALFGPLGWALMSLFEKHPPK